MLELNARPGLNIQIANAAGLLPRLEYVQQHAEPALLPEDRVAWIQSLVNDRTAGWQSA
jgi:hypothetical protein